MAWTFWLCDTRTGRKQFRVDPESANFSVAINSAGEQSVSFRMGEGPIDREQWREYTRKWAYSLARCWDDGTNEYVIAAGPIVARTYSPATRTLTLKAKGIREFFSKRWPFGVTGYWESPAEALPGRLVIQNQTLVSIAARVIEQGLTGPFPMYSLPIELSPVEAGQHSRTYENYLVPTVEDALQEIQEVEGGPDFDFWARWNSNDTLGWVMRTGRLPGSTWYFDLSAPQPEMILESVTDDGQTQTTGILAVGAGSEQDMAVAGFGLGSVSPFTTPALDRSIQLKDIDSKQILFSHAVTEVTTLTNGTEQWSVSIPAGGLQGVEKLRIGDSIAIKSDGDPWIFDGLRTFRLIGFSGDLSDRIKLELQ